MTDYGQMHQYDDIIHLPHPVSRTHPPMPVADRAAQFAPFAALAGHGEAVKEASRLTEERIELDEDSKAALDWKLREIEARLGTDPAVSVIRFVPDAKKKGGSYVNVTGQVKRIDRYGRILILADGMGIPVDEILELDIIP